MDTNFEENSGESYILNDYVRRQLAYSAYARLRASNLVKPKYNSPSPKAPAVCKVGGSVADVCKGCKLSGFVLDYIAKLDGEIETLKNTISELEATPIVVGGELVEDKTRNSSIYVRLDFSNGETAEIDMSKLNELVPEITAKWPDIANVEGGGAGEGDYENDDDVKFNKGE